MTSVSQRASLHIKMCKHHPPRETRRNAVAGNNLSRCNFKSLSFSVYANARMAGVNIVPQSATRGTLGHFGFTFQSLLFHTESALVIDPTQLSRFSVQNKRWGEKRCACFQVLTGRDFSTDRVVFVLKILNTTPVNWSPQLFCLQAERGWVNTRNTQSRSKSTPSTRHALWIRCGKQAHV